IMYLGKFCEVGPLNEVYKNSGHPYTHALLEAVPVPDPQHRHTEALPSGEIPSAINPPPGCRFHPRCPIARPNCAVDIPHLRELQPQHSIACHYAEDLLK
ncbi:MAG: oligopeptide/dipeptide ABC transporter ATP-binding protein, partial [Anaerolineales bacterium]